MYIRKEKRYTLQIVNKRSGKITVVHSSNDIGYIRRIAYKYFKTEGGKLENGTEKAIFHERGKEVDRWGNTKTNG